jgi:hypothetical protein
LTPPKAKVEAGWHYEAAEKSALELEALLAVHGIRIQPGGSLEQDVLAVLHLVSQKRARLADPTKEDIRPAYRTLIGVHEFASLLLSVQHNPQFTVLLPHLRLLNEGRALQNTPSSGTDQAANKLFELYMAAVAIQCGEQVALDDPHSSRGDNPDILVTIRGQRWGIACKVLHGKTPQGFLDNLAKGLDQIDRSSAQIGVVAFNFKNIMEHDRIWPLAPIDGIAGNPLTAASWSDPNAPFQILVAQLQDIGVEIVSYLPAGSLPALFDGHKSIPGFLAWGASPSAAFINGRPTPCSVRALNFQNAAPISSEVQAVLACLNWSIYADSEDRGPGPC